MRGRGNGGLVGELAPGTDAAGRIHPFSIFAVLENDSLRSARTGEAFRVSGAHDAVASAMQKARASDDPAKLTESVREIRAVLPAASADEPDYRNYVDGRSCGDFWSAIAGDPLHPVRYQVLQALYETVEYLRGRNATDVRMGIRFPLPKSSAPLAIGFWIDLVGRLFRGPIDGCSYFWTDGDEARWEPQLLFFFSTPTSPQFLALIDPGSDVESISYLQRPYGGPSEARMNEALRAILDDAGTPMRALLDWATRS